MLLIGKDRKIMNILVEHDFGSLANQEKSGFIPTGMEVSTIAKKAKLTEEDVYLRIKKLVAYGLLAWTDKRPHWTVHSAGVTNSGFVEYKDGYKKYIKDLLIALAASAPFVSLLIYFHQIS